MQERIHINNKIVIDLVTDKCQPFCLFIYFLLHVLFITIALSVSLSEIKSIL